jgi:Protein of unknown function (DUF2829)
MTDGQNFSIALANLTSGLKVARDIWDDAYGSVVRFVALQAGYPDGIAINAYTARATGLPEGSVWSFEPYLMTMTEAGTFEPWIPSMSDILATDWKTC